MGGLSKELWMYKIPSVPQNIVMDLHNVMSVQSSFGCFMFIRFGCIHSNGWQVSCSLKLTPSLRPAVFQSGVGVEIDSFHLHTKMGGLSKELLDRSRSPFGLNVENIPQNIVSPVKHRYGSA